MPDESNVALSTHGMLSTYLDAYALRADDPQAYTGVRIPQAEFTENVGSFEPGWYVVIGGYEKSGKTTLMMTLAKLFALAKKSVAYFSMEMGPGQLAPKLLSSITDIDVSAFREFKLTPLRGAKQVEAAGRQGPARSQVRARSLA